MRENGLPRHHSTRKYPSPNGQQRNLRTAVDRRQEVPLFLKFRVVRRRLAWREAFRRSGICPIVSRGESPGRPVGREVLKFSKVVSQSAQKVDLQKYHEFRQA